MIESEDRRRDRQQRKGGATEEVRERETTNIRDPVSDSPLSPSSASQTPVTCHPPHQRPSPFPPPLPVLPYVIATIQSYYSLQYRTPTNSPPFDGGPARGRDRPALGAQSHSGPGRNNWAADIGPVSPHALLSRQPHAACTLQVFLRTGPDSGVEYGAPDRSVCRVERVEHRLMFGC